MLNMLKPLPMLKLKLIKLIPTLLLNLLRMDYIPEAYKISNDKRVLRDALRARLKIVQRHTSVTNSMHLLLAKYNYDSPNHLSGISKYQYNQLSDTEKLLKEQILDYRKTTLSRP